MALMDDHESPLRDWTPAQIEQGRLWVESWRRAGVELERVRREELRNLRTFHAISLLCTDAMIRPEPSPTSGLVEQQRLFMRAIRRE